jgi:putative ABC transport system substrate-binding protein
MKTWFPIVLITFVLALSEGFAGAQQPTKVPRVGIFGGLLYPHSRILEAFRRGLREVGYIEGQNIILEPRFVLGIRTTQENAAEMVRLPVDVMVTTNTPAIYAAMSATKTIPIVITYVGDPVAAGFIASLERPGGNVTGVGGLATELGGKWLELVKETVPAADRIAVFWNRQAENESPQSHGVEVAARALRVELQWLEVQNQRDLEGAFSAAASKGASAFIMLPSLVFGNNLKAVTYLALKSRLPGIFWRADFAGAGGLMAYGANQLEQSRRAAYVVHKILKGAKPAELPIELPKKFELVINLKTAKEIGVKIPDTMLTWADRIIK